jgi:hypothetical protein
MNILKKLLGRAKPNLSKAETVISILKNHPFIGAHNRETLIESIREGNEKHYLNPRHQNCFNYGSFTLDEFLMWVDGKGPIVKGRTQEEKDKFMFYAEKYEELDLNLFIYFNYLHLLKDDVQPSLPTPMHEGEPINPNLSEEDTIRGILSSYVPSLRKDMMSMDHQNLKREWNEISWGVIKTLMLMGYGYSGANNLPEEICNLSWSKDLVYAKAYYLYLQDKGIEIPDIKYVEENRYTNYDEED